MDAHADLMKLLTVMRGKRHFVVDEWIDKKTDMLIEYMSKCGLKACVISVSGGIDSAVVLGLCLKAQKKQNSPIKRVLAIAQPIKSTEAIWKRALECREHMGAEVVVVDQSAIHTQLVDIVQEATQIKGNSFSDGQLRSYMRTPVGFYVAQLLSQQGNPAIVMGTGNFDEDGYLAYFCKAGDGVVDVQLIADLHKSEVFQVADHLNVPESIRKAPPSADLWEGQTDEEELGFTYNFVELYTEYLQLSEPEKLEFTSQLAPESLEYFTTVAKTVDDVHRRNSHKLHFPVNLNILKTFA